jgi:mono/diheme cytochrome c family protein
MFARLKSLLLVLALIVSSVAYAETPFERGRYLATGVMACANCHTPKDAAGPIKDRAFAGGSVFDTPAFKVASANLTADRATGIAQRTDDELRNLIVKGERANGSPLAPIMPSAFYGILTKDDLNGLIAYLRSLQPIRNEVPAPEYKRPVKHEAFPGADTPFTPKDLRNKLKRGFYYVTIGHCMECHTPMEKGVAQFDTNLGKGGREFKGPWGSVKSANITSSKTAGIGGWSDADIRRAITTGVRPDGRKLTGPMSFASYANLRRPDLDAMVAYLRTIPPKD